MRTKERTNSKGIGKQSEGTTVPVCPDCDVASVRRRVSSTHSPDDVDYNWYCRNCLGKFETVEYREKKSNPGLCGLARKLDDMDPEEIEW